MSRKYLRPGVLWGALAAALLASTSAWSQSQPTTNVPGTPEGTGADTATQEDQGTEPQPGPVQQQPSPYLKPGYPTPQQGPPTPGFTVSGNVGLSETYSTNITGAANSENQQGGFDSRVNLGVNALEHTADLTGALSASGQLDIFAYDPGAPVIGTTINGLLDYRPFPEYLHIDVRVFASPISDNPLGAIQTPGTPLPQGANSNTSDVYGYSISPAIEFRLGSFARSDLVPSFSQVYFVSPAGAPPPALIVLDNLPPPKLTNESIVEKISSGDNFWRFRWQLTGSDLEQSAEALGLKQRQGTANIQYAITRQFAFLAEGGYQQILSDTLLSQNLSGLVAYGGLMVHLSQLSEFQFEAGEEFNSPSYIGSASMIFGSRTYFVAQLTDSIQTPAGRLLGNLQSMNVDVQNDGSFDLYNSNYVPATVTPSTFSAFSAVPIDGLGFNTTIERYRAGQATLTHKYLSTDFSLTAFGTIADILSPVPVGEGRHQTSEGVALQASRQLSPDLGVNASVGYSYEDISLETDKYISVTAGATYSLSAKLRAYATVSYFDRVGAGSLSTLYPQVGTANVMTATIGISRSF